MLTNTSVKFETVRQKVEEKKTELEMLGDEIGKVEGMFFSRDRAREFFSDIEPMAIQAGCSVVSIAAVPKDPREETDDEQTEEGEETKARSRIVVERISVSISGKYSSLIKFFERLKTYTELICVEDMLIESVDERTNELLCYTTFAINVVEDKEIKKDEPQRND